MKRGIVLLVLSGWLQVYGQVMVSSDGHWLEFNNEKKLLVGESITQGWMELGPDFNQTAYLDSLAARGINVLHLWSYIGIDDQTADARIGYNAPEIWPWLQPGGTFDLTQHNQVYFNRLKSLIQYANGKDIVVIIQLHDGWTKTRFSGHPFNTVNGGPLTSNGQYVELHDYNNEMPTTYNSGWSRQQKHQYFLERYCEKMIDETAGLPNVIYEIFNEGEWYNQTNLRAFQVHFLNFIKARTSYLTMVNDDHVGGANFRGEANCDIISWHRPLWSGSSSATESFNHYAPAFNGTPAKPYYFSEPVPSYEGVANTNDGMMRLMWGTLMAGAGFVVQNDASWGFDPNTNMAANIAVNLIMLDREGHCARFFNDSGVNFWNMTPNGGYSSTGVALVDPGKEYVVYSESGNSITINLSDAAGKILDVRYYNPRTGAYQPAISISGGAASQIIYTPTSSDWVIHLKVSSPAIVVNKTATICDGDSFFVAGGYQTQSGTYTDTFTSSNGTDSIYITNLSVLTNSMDIPIQSGWNMISGYISPYHPGMENIFNEISSEVLIVKDNTGLSFIPSLGINSIGDWKVQEGYKVKAANNTSLTLRCEQVDPVTTPVPLLVGWNMIAYLRTSSLDVATAVNGISSNIILVKDAGGNTYIPSLSINGIGTQDPGQGYKFKMSSADTLYYPAN